MTGDLDQGALLLAVDGGQSSTLALLATPAGQVLGYGRAGPSNHLHEPGGLARLEAALRGSISAALQQAERSPAAVGYSCLGLSGGPAVAQEIAASLLPQSAIEVHKDIVTALAGASRAQPGVIVIAGTGAVAYGEQDGGRRAIADGWGYIMGDEGSAYDIGCAALRAACRAEDGRGPETVLLQRIPAHFDLADLRAVHRAIYSHALTRPQVASLAQVVGQAAHAGDAVAQGLLAEAGHRLGKSALAVIRRLGGLATGLPVFTTGGVFEAGEFVLGPFRAVLAGECPTATIHPPRFSPVVGALLLAMRAADIQVTEQIIAAIDASLPAAAISKHMQRPA